MARGLEWAGMGRKEATRTCAFAAEEVEEGCNPDRERAKDRLGRETGGCAIHRDFAQKGVYSSYTRKKRYYFEGLKARATGYVRLGRPRRTATARGPAILKITARRARSP